MIWPDFNPNSLSIDFERAIIKVIHAVFPEALLHRCLLHLADNMGAKHEDHGLICRHNSNPNFSINTKMIAAIAFMPQNSIKAAITAI
ncbi:hypothetical protein MXB_2931 [Myxobolus squamalis]|nr:hypothetical protein MXB_2931 [Myxobolus squamalis]